MFFLIPSNFISFYLRYTHELFLRYQVKDSLGMQEFSCTIESAIKRLYVMLTTLKNMPYIGYLHDEFLTARLVLFPAVLKLISELYSH